MMGTNGIDNIIGLTVFFHQITPDHRMRAFHFVVYGLADIMEQTGPLGLFHIQAQFRRHNTAEKGYFQRML